MFAVDLSGDGFADNLSVIKAPHFETTSQSGKDALKGQIESFGGSNVAFTTTTINGRQVLVAQYDLSITASDGSQTPAFGGQAYVSAGSKESTLDCFRQSGGVYKRRSRVAPADVGLAGRMPAS